MENTCIIGYGVVGQATAKALGIKKYFDLKESNITLDEAAKLRFIFIALPTELKPDGSYNTSDIEAIIRQLEELGSSALYIIRSTIWPGFAKHLQEELGIDRIISNPEFLNEATAERDAKNPPFVLIGGIVPRYLEEVKGLYEGMVKGAPVILTDNITAELAKLSMNAYFSTKVVFANQVFDIAQSLGANYEKVKEVLERHPFGPKNHFQIWYKGKRGVNGRCLPKDSKALAHYSKFPLLSTVMELNEEYIYQKKS